jgi:eukaryotic-like serine/threonine-protein kinase
MKAERWKQIDDLLQSTLDLPSEGRAAFLAQACAGDEVLRLEVESLLTHYAQAGDFLEAPPSEMAADILQPDHARLTENERIGHYTIRALLGVGGMGEVYLAQDTRLDRKVALKLLPAQFTANEDRKQRFEQEARSASALNHPNIVTIHEISQHEGTHFIVTEYIEGQTLRHRLADGPMKFIEALDVAIQVANALEAAHTAGIIHRDIKPENIMLRPDGLVKVLDFGLAKFIGAPTSTFKAGFPTANLSRTAVGMLSGTVQYMSPEQAQGQEVDARGDIWSLGVVLYEMVTGHPPFTGRTISEVLAAILKDIPLPLAESTSSVPPELEAIERKAFAKSLEERYASAREMHLDLKKLDEELKLQSKLGERSPAIPTQQPFVMINRRQAMWLAGTAVAALAGLTVWQFRPRGLPKLAVLPFRNTEKNTEAETICQYLTAQLIYTLQDTPWLDVTPLDTVSSFNDQDVSPREAGSKLGASFILIGDVRLENRDPVINAALYSAATGKELWNETYNSFSYSTHEPIASAIIDQEELRILTDFELEQRKALPSVSEEAWNFYWRGRRQRHLENPTGYEKALEFFQRAFKFDSKFALASASAAGMWSAKAIDGIESPKECFKNQSDYLQMATELDRNLPGVHSERAVRAFLWDWDWRTAEEHFELSITPRRGYVIDPSYYGLYALECWAVRRLDKAFDLAATARKTDKRPGLLEANLMLSQGNIDDAIKRYKDIVRLYPGKENPRLGLAEAYRIKEDFRNAIAILRPIAARNGLIDESFGQLSTGSGKDGYREIVHAMAHADLQALDIKDAAAEYVSRLDLARDYVRLDDRDTAFRYLEEAFDERAPGLVFLKVDPVWNAVRDDKRFQGFVGRMKFP